MKHILHENPSEQRMQVYNMRPPPLIRVERVGAYL